MRFHVGDRYLSKDRKLEASVVEIIDEGRSAIFLLVSGERQTVNIAHVMAGYWQKIP